MHSANLKKKRHQYEMEFYEEYHHVYIDFNVKVGRKHLVFMPGYL